MYDAPPTGKCRECDANDAEIWFSKCSLCTARGYAYGICKPCHIKIVEQTIADAVPYLEKIKADYYNGDTVGKHSPHGKLLEG